MARGVALAGWLERIRIPAAVLVYPPLLLFLPSPVNLTLAPLISGIIAGYKCRSQRRAALIGVIAGILGPAIVTFSMGPVQVTMKIMTEMLGVIGPVVPHIYYSLASTLTGMLAYRITTRTLQEEAITGMGNIDPLG